MVPNGPQKLWNISLCAHHCHGAMLAHSPCPSWILIKRAAAQLYEFDLTTGSKSVVITSNTFTLLHAACHKGDDTVLYLTDK